MVNEVNRIIKNTLIGKGALTLPTVGTLRIVRKSAQLVGKGISTPEYAIIFSSSEDAQSLVDTIASVASISVADAEDIYLRWLDKVREDGRVVINGIGSICDKSFKAEDDIISKLNPNRGAVITLTKRRRRSVGCLSLIILMLICAAIGLYLYFTGYFANNSVQENVICAATESVEVIEEDVNVSTNIASEVDDVVENHQVADGNNSIDQEVAEDVIIEEVTTPEEVVVGPWYEVDDIKHYVIIGSYKRCSNANGVIADLASNEAVEVDCQVIERGKMYSVAIFGSANIATCESYVMEHKEQFPQAWIYSVE